MKRSDGKTISIYISPEAMLAYQNLRNYSDSTGNSVSELISRGLENTMLEDALRLTISVQALVAISHGNFEDLNFLKLDNGRNIVTVKEDVYKPKDGSEGKYASEIQEMNAMYGLEQR